MTGARSWSRWFSAKAEQKHVELAPQLAQQVVDPHRAAVRERVRKIRRNDAHATALARHGRPSSARWSLGYTLRSLFQGHSQEGRSQMRSSGTPRRNSTKRSNT